MNNTQQNSKHDPVCIKCGYDLCGEIATWQTQCPLNGQCPECGLEFEWRQVYAIQNEWGSEVDWYAEHASGWAGLFKRTPKTMLRLVFPIWFFKGINHRRAIRLGMLIRWWILVSVLMQLVISPIGMIANKVEYVWSNAGYNSPWWVSFLDSMCNAASGFCFPLFAVRQYRNGAIELYSVFGYYEEWAAYMLLGIVLIGVTLSWSALMGVVFLLRWKDGFDHRHELGLFGRLIVLSLLPIPIYIQIVRLGFGIYVIDGQTSATNWVPWVYLISFLALIFWQQVLWTHAVRTIWEIKRSWVINIGGFFGSIIGGLFFTYWILA